MLPIRAESTVSTYGSVEIARLKMKKEDEQLAVLTNSSLVLPRWLLATLTVLVITEHSRMKVRYPQSLTTVVLAEVSRLPFVLLHMACLCHPYIQSTNSDTRLEGIDSYTKDYSKVRTGQ